VLDDNFSAATAEAVTQGRGYFVNFLREAPVDEETGELGEAPNVYEFSEDLANMRVIATGYMGRFNESFKLLRMDLVLFHDALEHVMRSPLQPFTPQPSYHHTTPPHHCFFLTSPLTVYR